MEWNELQAVASRTVAATDRNCDAGNSLRDVLDALIDANLDEHEEDGSDAEYDTKKKAEAFLFVLASNWVAHKKTLENAR